MKEVLTENSALVKLFRALLAKRAGEIQPGRGMGGFPVYFFTYLNDFIHPVTFPVALKGSYHI